MRNRIQYIAMFESCDKLKPQAGKNGFCVNGTDKAERLRFSAWATVGEIKSSLKVEKINLMNLLRAQGS